jgi:hypothetical protein
MLEGKLTLTEGLGKGTLLVHFLLNERLAFLRAELPASLKRGALTLKVNLTIKCKQIHSRDKTRQAFSKAKLHTTPAV